MSSERFTAGLREIEEGWSIVDLYDAHAVLDMYDKLARKVQEAS